MAPSTIQATMPKKLKEKNICHCDIAVTAFKDIPKFPRIPKSNISNAHNDATEYPNAKLLIL